MFFAWRFCSKVKKPWRSVSWNWQMNFRTAEWEIYLELEFKMKVHEKLWATELLKACCIWLWQSILFVSVFMETPTHTNTVSLYIVWYGMTHLVWVTQPGCHGNDWCCVLCEAETEDISFWGSNCNDKRPISSAACQERTSMNLFLRGGGKKREREREE